MKEVLMVSIEKAFDIAEAMLDELTKRDNKYNE